MITLLLPGRVDGHGLGGGGILGVRDGALVAIGDEGVIQGGPLLGALGSAYLLREIP